MNLYQTKMICDENQWPIGLIQRRVFAEIAIPTANGMLVWTPDLAYPCVLEQPATDEYEVFA
jgi:hypothetical protein